MRSTMARPFLFLIAAIICQATPSVAQVVAVPTIPSEDGLYLVARLIDHAEPGYVPVQTRTGPAWAAVGARVTARNVRVSSASSTNDRFSVWFAWPTSVANGSECVGTGSLLRVDGAWRFMQSDRGNVRSCTYSNGAFADEPRGFAARMAAVLGATPIFWMTIGERVTGSYAPVKTVFQRDDTVAFTFTLRNPADAPLVWRQVVGNYWAGWRVSVTRDGTELRESGLGRGGSGGALTTQFRPGATSVSTIRVGDWTRDELGPGHYVVKITTVMQFFPDENGARGPASPGAQHTYTGTVEFDIAGFRPATR